MLVYLQRPIKVLWPVLWPAAVNYPKFQKEFEENRNGRIYPWAVSVDIKGYQCYNEARTKLLVKVPCEADLLVRQGPPPRLFRVRDGSYRASVFAHNAPCSVVTRIKKELESRERTPEESYLLAVYLSPSFDRVREFNYLLAHLRGAK